MIGKRKIKKVLQVRKKIKLICESVIILRNMWIYPALETVMRKEYIPKVYFLNKFNFRILTFPYVKFLYVYY